MVNSQVYDQQGCSYLYNIDAHLEGGDEEEEHPELNRLYVLDADKMGNVIHSY